MFIRPLLGVRRKDLREWLVAEEIEWREDPTNEDLRFERNWTRNVVLPLLRERRAGIDEVLARTATRAREDEEALDALAREVLSRAQVDDVGILLNRVDLQAQPPAIRSRVVIGALRLLGADPSHTDVDAILRGSTRHGCDHVSVWPLDGGLAFVREPVAVPSPVLLDQDQSIGAWGIRVRKATTADTPAWPWRCGIPDRTSKVTIRSRRPGDRVITPAGTKKVQDVLVDAKVPRPLRDLVPILATNDEALAVVGLTHRPEETATVIDVAPSSPLSWSRGALWSRK
jgi:tRNA(Ile)-lysidine synthase